MQATSLFHDDHHLFFHTNYGSVLLLCLKPSLPRGDVDVVPYQHSARISIRT